MTQLIAERVLTVFPDAVRIVLFGSRAYGNPSPNSDYDLLVVADTALPAAVRGATVRLALRDIPEAFDILVVTPEELGRLVELRSGVIAGAARHGETLYAAS